MVLGEIRVGIGVITFNRRQHLERTIDQIKLHTKRSFDLIVADDGSTDGSREMLIARGCSVITGPNMGVCWNKNRALFYLHEIAKCSVIILIEDDTRPVSDGWEDIWIEAALRHGHVGFAGSWFKENFLSGKGSAKDPFLSPVLSGQCSAFGGNSLSYVGYLDTRFKGYGVGHAEHSIRLARAGYGGEVCVIDGKEQCRFYLISSDLEVADPGGNRNDEQIKLNHAVHQSIDGEQLYRHCWRSDNEMMQLRDEVSSIRIASSPSSTTALLSTPASPILNELQPRMSTEELSLFQSFLEKSLNYLEFGTGGSTVIASRHVRKSVISVDSSREWQDLTADYCTRVGVQVTPHFIHADIGPVGDWGYPLDESCKSQWPTYTTKVWDNPNSGLCDLCLVDGRFRVASFLSVLLRCSPVTTILFHDFTRPPYQLVRDFADEIAVAETLTAFKPKESFDKELAIKILETYSYQPA